MRTPDTKDVRRWVNDGTGTLTEVAAGADGRHDLAAVAAQLRGSGGVVQLCTDGQIQPI
jgi:hypothetical protein